MAYQAAVLCRRTGAWNLSKLADFASLVQLGVGLHTGTALLQSITEFSGGPLARKLARLTSIARERATKDPRFAASQSRGEELAGELEMKVVQFFNEYKIASLINAGAA